MRRTGINIFVFLLCCMTSLCAAGQDYYSPRMRTEYAWAAYHSGKYNTALTESESLLLTGERSDTLHYLAARSLLRLHRLPDAAVHFSSLRADTGASYRMGLAVRAFDSFMKNMPEEVIPFTDTLNQTGDRYRDYGRLLKCATLLNNLDTASYSIYKEESAVKDLYVRKAFGRIDEEILAFGQQKQKSPAKAGVLSALVPGAGKMYIGRWGPGLLSLAGTGALGVQAWEGYRKGGIRNAQFITFGSLLLLGYAANIYGTVVQTRRYNVQIVTDFRKGVALEVDVAFDRLFQD